MELLGLTLGAALIFWATLIAIFAIPLWMIAIKLWNWHDDAKKSRWYESSENHQHKELH